MYSMTITLSGLYKDYWELGQGLLRMVGTIHKVEITDDDVEALKRGMMTMPAHPDECGAAVAAWVVPPV
jgi:2-haloacid dehalogenase